LTITDLCGNTTSSQATVEVVNDAPVAVCKTFDAEADTVCCIIVNKTDIDGGSYDPDGAGDIKSFGITAIDGNPVTLANEVEVCGVGWHTVTLTITDWCDSTSSCDADVEVIDVTPPEMTILLNRDMLWPPNHKYADIIADIEVKDNCDPNPTFVLTSVSSSEPDNDKGDGNTVNDIADYTIGVPDTTISLRSERRGGGEGRKYTIRWTASDASGNSRIDSACVWVPHDQSGDAVCSFGFTALGQTVEDNADHVSLVFVTHPPTSISWRDPSIWIGGWDATKMDPMDILLGNTRGAIRPAWTTTAYDVNNDGLKDMMASFSAKEVRELMDIGMNDLKDGAAKKKGAAESLGLHYIGPGGDTYLVGNIFTLGEPVIPLMAKWGDNYEPEGDKTPAKPKSLVTIYPNPFNPATTIDFYMAANENALLAIYDVSGRLVKVLHDGVASEGLHSVRWDGTDSKGMSVTSGIYFTRFITASHELTKKMILLK